jgi:prevent-host-death family protein
MKTVSIREAKNRLTELAREVERGETIVVTRNGSPAFELAPHRAAHGPSPSGDRGVQAEARDRNYRNFHRR